MKKLVRWLREVEHKANDIYLKAATLYADDPQFKAFLEQIAEDEAWHYHVMGSAAEHFNSTPPPVSVISVDKDTSDKVMNLFSDIRERLEKKTISKEEFIEKIVEAELSEWNDIFLYVVNILKEKTNEFIYPIIRIQGHIKKIVRFLEKTGNHSIILKKLRELPPVWTENILIVDDEEMITTLIKSLLNRDGNIDVANNGEQALNYLENKFYKLVISDIDLPKMDGLSFYKKSVDKFPTLKKRFLFMSGDLSPERKAFFDENNLKYLSKPMKIKVLREAASEIILSM
ncbi:MAG: response regulator [Desulfobacteraceae bacterium]|nr:response regulator [Desulfobacteraceae bacterium]MDH3723542.1 response regulator [Desulfobacteraceae bacterium]MDH3837986.1 response regulator [Desulfobacteraceae bacterium]MDH3957029.1 response regulator [Desulfobacteraceae bacterium]